MSELRPIETEYNNFQFRSRLEARWAVFFDALGVRYEYEPEGFNLGSGDYYLPDFYLPHLDMWIEIKPGNAPQYWGINVEYLTDTQMRPYVLASKLAEQSKKNVLILFGSPRYSSPDWYEHEQEMHYEGVLFFGTFAPPYVPLVGGFVLHTFESLSEFLPENGYPVEPFDGTIESAQRLIETDKQFYQSKHGKSHAKWQFGINEHRMYWDLSGDGLLFPKWEIDLYTPDGGVLFALEQAQKARFEWGEKPARYMPQPEIVVDYPDDGVNPLIKIARELGAYIPDDNIPF